MLDLDQQLQILSDESPKYGVPTEIMEKAVIPVLKLFALQLQHPSYYFLTSPQQGWVVTTLGRRQALHEEKRVIYVFANRKDVYNFQGVADNSLRVASLPVTHLLFQLFSLKEVNSMIFVENTNDTAQTKEIERATLQQIIQQQIKRIQKSDTGFYA